MNTTANANAAALSTTYQQKTDKEHILDNPETYIGSIENIDANMWVFDPETNRIVLKTIEYIPGEYKLFDEGIVNCRDHVIRMIQSPAVNKKTVSYIDISIDPNDGTICMTNDGNGIDIARHPENNMWIPEMIFGHLRTSTNYNKEEKRIVGGKNGFGVKLIFIWSVWGRVETVDHTRGLKYIQEFHRNLDQIGEPVVTKVAASLAAKPYTKISFRPDYARMGISGLTADMLALLQKRVYDIAAVSDHSVKKIKVSLNGAVVPVRNFQQYIDLYIGAKDAAKRVYEMPDDRWEYAVALATNHEFTAVSFVNGICTYKGGKHVDYIVGQIVRKLTDYIEKKKKVKVNPSSIKEQLVLFLRCDIENPAFDSQTKDFMNTPVGKFGSSCTVSDGFIEKVAKMGVMDMACSLTEAKEVRQLKKTDGAKTKHIRGIANFMDANLSGGPQSRDCILILCEGLSAMSGIVSGLSSEDRNYIGIYPLKGKMLNVRGEVAKKIGENKEIGDIKKIMGLETGKVYGTIEDVQQNLRYGKIVIMTDQDLDGSHIKGLVINVFHSEWASLIQIPGFISFMNTPILRARKGGQTRLFYNDGEYLRWKAEQGEAGLRGWTIKYFKGLGTSTSAEFKEYFANKKIVNFVYAGHTDDIIDRSFNKKRADDRKLWLEAYDKTAYLDTGRADVQYEEFIDRELIHFSTYDCARSIPSMVDGLKISLRKILYSAFKRRLTGEVKVAQFSGYVSEHSAYHHGEASLNGAIVNMAQNYVGSNNINLLEPLGQFGTRLQGGDDSASERYIFTQLNTLTRTIFPEADDAILKYTDDDGTVVEPEYYVPIIPFVLINGISGIGTGFSSSIPSFDPRDIVRYLRARLGGGGGAFVLQGISGGGGAPAPATPTPPTDAFVPYYEGFTGTVRKLTDTKFLIVGKYDNLGNDQIRIKELPVGTWTMPYITFLEGLLDGVVDKSGKKSAAQIRDMVSLSTEKVVDITVTLPKGQLAVLEAAVDGETGLNGVHKLLKLSTTVSTTNMHLFDKDMKLHKYGSVAEIIDAFYPVRIETYRVRKAALLEELSNRLIRLSNRERYILAILAGEIDLRRKTNAQVDAMLEAASYTRIGEGGYDYLTKMAMNSVTEENVAKIVREKAETEAQRVALEAKTVEAMWLDELDVFDREYASYRVIRERIQAEGVKSGGGAGGAAKKPKTVGGGVKKVNGGGVSR
jgi:DNA topoisomerase-2